MTDLTENHEEQTLPSTSGTNKQELSATQGLWQQALPQGSQIISVSGTPVTQVKTA